MSFLPLKGPLLKFTNLPLRWLLVGTFVVQTAAAIGLTSWVSLRNGEQAVNEVAQHWQQETVERIQIQLNDYLRTPNLINQLNAQSLKSGELKIENPTQLTQHFWHQQNLFDTASVSAIYFGSAMGDFVGLGFQKNSFQGDKTSKNAWQASRVNRTTQHRFYSYALDTAGNVGQLLQQGKAYDPRKRPWYQAATQARKPTWSPIYPDFKEVRLKLTFSQPVYDGKQNLLGVVGTDFVLSHLGDFLRSLNPNQQGQIYILDREGEIVATSTQYPPFIQNGSQLQRIQAIQFQDSVTQQSTQTLLQSIGSLKTLQQSRSLTAQFNHQRYFLQITPFRQRDGLDWLIVVVVPETHFLQVIQANTRITILWCVLILLGSVLFGLITSRLIVRSIRQFIQASQAIADGDLAQRLPISFVQEVNTLSQTFNRMSHQLQQSFANLEARVQERTAALQQSEEKFAKVFFHHPNPVAITRLEDAIFVDINDSALKIIGYERHEIIGHTIADFNIGVTLEQRQETIRIIREAGGALRDRESRMLTRAGEWKTILYSADLMQVGDEWYLINSFNDISDRKRAEEALEVAKIAAESANLAKSQFLSTMSHELRTPLNAILGFSQLLSRDPALSKQQQESLNIINRSGEHLLVLINDVLDMAKIEAGRQELHATSFDLHQLIYSLEELFRLKSSMKGIELHFELSADLPQYVNTDETKLRQVLQNLLSNALKFTQTGSIQLRVRVLEAQAGKTTCQLQFEVKDTGCGIASHELNSIFEAFVQTQSGRNAQTGTGLGLPISQKFVELMGGAITVHSELGVGTQFNFSIQVDYPSAQDLIALESIHHPTKHVIGLAPGQPTHRILIADDRWESRRLLSSLLSPLGFEIQEATNGQEVIQICDKWLPHLIWMDMKMPIMNGYAATREIKTNPKHHQPIIIAITASVLDEEQESVLSAGCDDFVRKPFRAEVIFQKLQSHLGLEYVYEESTILSMHQQSDVIQELTHEDLSHMPLEWIQKLHQAAGEVSNQDILRLLKEIPSEKDDVATKISYIVQNFRCDKLFDLTEKILHDNRTQPI